MTEATRVVPTGPRWHPTPDVEQKGRLVSELLSPLGRLERIKQQLGARKISVADVAWLCGQVYRQRVSLVIYGQHRQTCTVFAPGARAFPITQRRCSCGFNEVLS